MFPRSLQILVALGLVSLIGCRATSPGRPRLLNAERQAKPIEQPPSVDVGGLVERPQSLVIPPGGLTLLQALARAGDLRKGESNLSADYVVALQKHSRISTQTYYIPLSLARHDAAGGILLDDRDLIQLVNAKDTGLIPSDFDPFAEWSDESDDSEADAADETVPEESDDSGEAADETVPEESDDSGTEAADETVPEESDERAEPAAEGTKRFFTIVGKAPRPEPYEIKEGLEKVADLAGLAPKGATLIVLSRRPFSSLATQHHLIQIGESAGRIEYQFAKIRENDVVTFTRLERMPIVLRSLLTALRSDVAQDRRRRLLQYRRMQDRLPSNDDESALQALRRATTTAFGRLPSIR